MPEALIIVESPAKARTIARLVGKRFVVESSIGHIRDLPSNRSEIPTAQKGKPWARMGVDVDAHFEPLYIVPSDKKAQVKRLQTLLKDAKILYLATDEDREGEAIAWHLSEVLKPKIPVHRMVFHEITKRAVDQALAHPRQIDRQLVAAQEARRILDRLYGYEVSPVLWRKVRPRLSAGRVQSVATRLVVERERRRIEFRAASYASVLATLLPKGAVPNRGNGDKLTVLAELQELQDRRVATGRHFDPTGTLSTAARSEGVLQLTEADATAIAGALVPQAFTVVEVTKKPFVQKPHPPFITSTMQQEAARKLGFTAQRTMRVAQRLYENGYITYMRTDSTVLSEEALTAARAAVRKLYGGEYLPDAPRHYTKKAKGAQEAHEAIRPAGEVCRSPEQLSAELDGEQFNLYQLIWRRTVASQMKDAVGERTQVRISVDFPKAIELELSRQTIERGVFSASGQVISFAGYLRAYVEGADDPESEPEDKERILPALAVEDRLSALKLESRVHATKPPARYTEATLVRDLEERGIGRPSTYASIIQTIQDRGYVWKQGSALIPTLTAFAVVRLLEQYFSELVDYEFTARMENDLDEISEGKKEAKPWLTEFYFGVGEHSAPKSRKGSKGGSHSTSLAASGLRGLIGSGAENIDAREICSLELGQTAAGEPIAARVGRYGPYLQIGDSDRRTSIADDTPVEELSRDNAISLLERADVGNRVLGVDVATGKSVYLKTGSYGPYVQLGDPELTSKGHLKKGGRPRMASVWPSMDLASLALEDALLLLSFPRVVGHHPETGAEIVAQDGKYGPYISMEAGGKRDSRSLANHEELATITLDRALKLFAEPRQTSRRRTGNSVLSSLAESPVTGRPIEVRTGRFGPYVTDGQINATVPSGRDPNRLSFDEALELISAREEKLREQGVDPRAAKPAKKKPSTRLRTTTRKGKVAAGAR